MEKRVHPRAAFDSHVPCDIGVESHAGVPPAELAVFYGAVGCLDLLIERGARIDPTRMDGLLSRFLASCPWVDARVCVGSACRDPFGICVAHGAAGLVRCIDPIPIVQRLLATLPPYPAGTQRIPATRSTRLYRWPRTLRSRMHPWCPCSCHRVTRSGH
ncbi:hypothetical protein TW95_gp0207 [Pandoravirus inopinatum]|uniref:Ankyrin repeat protein n=1 Tax=Pandoravirus inopinatum TaxID=1605721 RepID=A0A0B5J825_9VIRU|nr:hypothetical protein TW95_gp0207 [Pandoravirus inopinatum]AJF96941.1 hypothetical protein [Pandoravirus inopinatum]